MKEKKPKKPRNISGKSNRTRSEKTNQNFQNQPAKNPEKLEQKLELQCEQTPGRPSKAELKELKLIEYLCRKGHSMYYMHEQINKLRAENGEEEIGYISFLKLRDRFPDFFEPMNTWMEEADKDVRAALRESALGAEIWEEKPVVLTKGYGPGEFDSEVEIVKVRKRVAPNSNSIQFWLSNRLPEEFKMRQDVNMTADIKKLQKLTDEELAALMREMINNPEKEIDINNIAINNTDEE